MSDTEFQLPHEWPRDPDTGEIVEIDGDRHTFVECLNCDIYECVDCNPEVFTEPCRLQETPMVSIRTLLNPRQLEVRFKELIKQGYILRSGEIVGKREPIPECKPGMHRLRVKSKTVTGEGINKRVAIVFNCVVCHNNYRQ